MTAPPKVSIPLEFAAGVLRCSIRQVLAGQQVVNTFHVYNGTGVFWDQASADTYVNSMRAAWATNILNRQCGVLTLGKVVGVDLTNATGVVATSTAADASGGNAAPCLPANVALCMSWPIGRHYRGGHPRTYLAALPTDAVQNANTFTSLAVSQLVAGMTAFRTACNATAVFSGGTQLIALHRKKAHAVLKPPTFDPLGTPSCDGGIDSQRRRLGKR